MVGVERDSAGGHATTTPDVATAKTSTGATALEVAGLRERMDGVSMKLDEVDRRVGVLEAARDGHLGSSQDDVSGKSASLGGRSHARATGTSADGKSADTTEPSRNRPESPADARPANIEVGADAQPRVPVPAASSLVLMLTDVQFEKWLGGTNPAPTGLAPAEDEGRGNWRQRRNATSATRSDRR